MPSPSPLPELVDAAPYPGAGDPEPLLVADWRRRVFACYATVRGAADPEAAWAGWCELRDTLFGGHSASPLPVAGRASFGGLDYFPYRPELRVLGDLEPAQPVEVLVGASDGAAIPFTRFAQVRFDLEGTEQRLDVYWLQTYGGGIFLPFADRTSGSATYAAGRYLLDTVKGADLGTVDDRLVLDFNFAYQPSCSYDDRWGCPLTPVANRLDVAVEAGERLLAARG